MQQGLTATCEDCGSERMQSETEDLGLAHEPVGRYAPAPVRQGHHLQRARHRPRVVPVAVREHHRIDAAHIDAEPDDVALEDGPCRTEACVVTTGSGW